MTSTLIKLQAKRAKAGQKGFTLVELAIVLVIIGLIVGGVLVGQDLIKAAEIRATISDIESYNSAANTFRTKYNGYPGDLLSTRATQFGFLGGAGTDGLGDGDGVLENGGTAANKPGIGGENLGFWEHMSAAGYIKEGFNAMTTSDGTPTDNLVVAQAVTAPNIPTILPGTRMRETTFIHAYGEGGRNHFLLANYGAVTVTTGAATPAAGVTVFEALNIDEKMDDGQPTGGVVRAMAATSTTNTTINIVDPGAATPAAGTDCVDEGAAPAIAGDETYFATSEDALNSVVCQVRIRASF